MADRQETQGFEMVTNNQDNTVEVAISVCRNCTKNFYASFPKSNITFRQVGEYLNRHQICWYCMAARIEKWHVLLSAERNPPMALFDERQKA